MSCMDKKYNEKTDWKYLLGGTVAIFGFIGACGNVVNMVETGAATPVSGAILAAQVASFAVPLGARGVKILIEKAEQKEIEAQERLQRQIDRENAIVELPSLEKMENGRQGLNNMRSNLRTQQRAAEDPYTQKAKRQVSKYASDLEKRGIYLTYEEMRKMEDVYARQERIKTEKALQRRNLQGQIEDIKLRAEIRSNSKRGSKSNNKKTRRSYKKVRTGRNEESSRTNARSK